MIEAREKLEIEHDSIHHYDTSRDPIATSIISKQIDPSPTIPKKFLRDQSRIYYLHIDNSYQQLGRKFPSRCKTPEQPITNAFRIGIYDKAVIN
mmetsp:Transcript_3603/g.7882  ORF Transcript_3603/g.7882 Transcript_3603/m.7882 type:complete len:94 (+) Transcript_3603:833-1114(+)